jgi:hypothetical protein
LKYYWLKKKLVVFVEEVKDLSGNGTRLMEKLCATVVEASNGIGTRM